MVGVVAGNEAAAAEVGGATEWSSRGQEVGASIRALTGRGGQKAC